MGNLNMKSISHLDPPMRDNEVVFELGSGVGAFLKVIHDNFENVQVWGSDVCPGPVGVAKQVFPDQKDHFIVADAKDWKPEIMQEEKFDHVFANFVMTYMKTEDDQISMLSNMLRATKKGGSLLVGFNVGVDTKRPGYTVNRTSILQFWTKLQSKLGYRVTAIEFGAEIHPTQEDRYFIYLQKMTH